MKDNLPKILRLEQEISKQKEKILCGTLDDPHQRQELQRLSDLVQAYNTIAELPMDLKYLMIEDNEAFSSVAGFVGDDTGLVDEDGFQMGRG